MLPRSIRLRVLFGSIVAIVAALIAVGIAIPSVARDHELIVAVIVGAVVATALSWLITRAIMRPIERIAAAVERGEEIGDVRGAEEVQRLAATLRRAAALVREERRIAQAERDHLAALIDQLGDAVFIADDDGRVELANAAARTLAGIDVIGRRLAEAIRDHEALEAIAAARAGGEHVATVERSEPRRFQRILVRPLSGGQLLVVVQDLTNLRRLETMRSDFVANVSHELRRPISSLKAMAETLEEGALDDSAAARDFVGRMHHEIDGLAQLVNELLALTRLESRAESLDKESRAPAQLLGEIARRMGPLAARAGVTLVVERSSATEVRVDPERIGQVLSNLVHNAVKFTPSGGTVRLRADDHGDSVLFSVTDTGVGIEPADLDRVFERFYKADRARSGEGTGLGLAIAKHVVQAHGGTIEARSAGAGRGATFRFTVPRA